MQIIKSFALLTFIVFQISFANPFRNGEDYRGKVRASRAKRTAKSPWPLQCVYTSMINQDNEWLLYRPILECCYKCREPHSECIKRTHPWFCYREAFACSTKCIVKAYWHGKNIPQNSGQMLQNYPLNSYFSKSSSSSVGSSTDDGYQSSPARRPTLPCFGHACYGKLCFRTQLCFKVETRYLTNVPVRV